MDSQSVSILIVEDYSADSYYFRELLKSASTVAQFKFLTATSLKECAAALRQHTVDIVCLDLGLPDSDGLDTLIKAKMLAGLTPIIVVTALEDPATLQGVRELGFDLLKKEILTANAFSARLGAS